MMLFPFFFFSFFLFFIIFQLKEEALRKELHTTRMALIKQVCNHNAEIDRVDDIVSWLQIIPHKVIKTYIIEK